MVDGGEEGLGVVDESAVWGGEAILEQVVFEPLGIYIPAAKPDLAGVGELAEMAEEVLVVGEVLLGNGCQCGRM